jgi:hypothetical protein
MHRALVPVQVLRGGESLLDKVDALEAAAARQREALAAQRAAAAAQARRIAELEEEAGALQGRHSSVQVRRRGAGVAGCCGRGRLGDWAVGRWPAGNRLRCGS